MYLHTLKEGTLSQGTIRKFQVTSLYSICIVSTGLWNQTSLGASTPYSRGKLSQFSRISWGELVQMANRKFCLYTKFCRQLYNKPKFTKVSCDTLLPPTLEHSSSTTATSTFFDFSHSMHKFIRCCSNQLKPHFRDVSCLIRAVHISMCSKLSSLTLGKRGGGGSFSCSDYTTGMFR